MARIITFPVCYIGLVILTLAGCSRNQEGAAVTESPSANTNLAVSRADPNVYQVTSNDTAMIATRYDALATTNQFLEAFRAKKEGTKDFFVKKAFRATSGGEEHIWIRVTDEKMGQLTGTISNDPQATSSIAKGDSVTLNVSEITDWKYNDGNKLIGGYSIRERMKQMSPQEKEAFLKKAGFEL